MAILKGFPPSNTISPSVRVTEKDLSFILPAQNPHTAGIVGFASKGPVNLPTAITSSRQLHTVFGNPHPDTGDPFLIYAADQYLLVASTLYVVRVADVDPVSDESATLAQVDVPASGSLVEIESATAGPTVFNEDSFFKWKLNGVASSKTLVVLQNLTGYNVDELVDALNDQLTDDDGIIFYISSSNTIGVKTVWAYGPSASLEMLSVQNAIYGGSVSDPDGIRDNPTGLGTDMERAYVTGSTAKYPNNMYQTSGVWDFSSFATDLTLDLLIDGTENVLIDQTMQQIVIPAGSVYGTTAALVLAINNQRLEDGGTLPGGWEALASGDNLKLTTKSHGFDARLRVKSTSTAADIFGLSTLTKVGVTTSGTTGDANIETFGKVSGSAVTSENSFTITADSVGIDGNYTEVIVQNNIYEPNFTIEVYANGVQVESWGNLSKNTASSYYVETYLALVSDFIRAIDNTATGATPKDGTYSLTGGSDGIPADPDAQDVLLMGDPVAYTGIYTMSEPEQINIDLIAVPGHSSTAVVEELLRFAQSYRQDCLAIIDPPFGLTATEVVAWQNGAHPLNSTKFDSDFGALYWPWVKIYDPYNKVDVWCPPSGSVMATIARSDFLSAPWFAPAGLTRGQVPGITDVYNRPTLAERDQMYGNRNCVNPIVNFTDVGGFVVFGQKTLQRRPTSLDRVNVRRMMFYVEKEIRSSCRVLLFEPNDSVFRSQFVSIAKSILDTVRSGRGITDYIIKADEELNTPDVIDRNEFRARIGIQPTRSTEFIFIEFSLHRTGSFAQGSETF